jgi:hypothetical protein
MPTLYYPNRRLATASCKIPYRKKAPTSRDLSFDTLPCRSRRSLPPGLRFRVMEEAGWSAPVLSIDRSISLLFVSVLRGRMNGGDRIGQ